MQKSPSLIWLLVTLAYVSAETLLECEHSTLDIQCPAGKIIKINEANYGRTADRSVCPHPSILTHDCSLDTAEEKIREVCENQNSCSLKITNGYFGHDPCVGTYKYAEVDYTCIPEVLPPKRPRNLLVAQECEHETVSLSCPEGKVIRVARADYGRDDSSTCPHECMLTTNCHLPSAKRLIKAVCENKNNCTFPATNTWFETDPCRGTFKYATVNYRCVRQRLPRPPPPGVARQQVCEHETMSIACPEGEEILIRKADYGRDDGTTCPSESMLTTDCHLQSALEQVRERCQNKNSCSFQATNTWFETDPCRGTFKYATVEYKCRPKRVRPTPPGVFKELICERETMSLSCPEGEEMLIRKADYGRSDGTTCPSTSMLTTECHLGTALEKVREHCQNRNSCNIPITNSWFETDPCKGTYKYATVEYKCRPKRVRPTPPGVFKELICERETMSLSCPKGQQLLIRKADYGRSDGTTCPSTSMLTTDCHLGSALAKVREHCQNKNSCNIPITNSWFETDPCRGTYKYATVEYKCRQERIRPTRHNIDVCEGEEANLQCPEGQELVVSQVNYGRKNRNACPSGDVALDREKCSLDGATAMVSTACQGLYNCGFSVNDAFFGSNPCPAGVRKFANILYQCRAPRNIR